MTGPEDLPPGVPGFDDPAYDDLRALLAGARVSDPLPADVAARLDDALAGLGAPSSADPGAGAAVVPLRPRRRTGQRLLVAASVVGVLAVGGIGLSKVLEGNGSGANDSAASTAAGDRTATGSSVPEAATGSTGSTGAGSAGGGVASGSNDGTGAAAGPGTSLPNLRTARFKADAVRVLTRAGILDGTATADQYSQSPARTPSPDIAGMRTLTALGCTPSGVPGATSYAVRLDGRPAVLVVRSADGGKRLVEALGCDGSVLTRALVD